MEVRNREVRIRFKDLKDGEHILRIDDFVLKIKKDTFSFSVSIVKVPLYTYFYLYPVAILCWLLQALGMKKQAMKIIMKLLRIKFVEVKGGRC